MSISVRNDKVSIRYRDSAGKLVRETLGHKRDVTPTQAKKIEAARLAEVKKGYRKPKTISFQALGRAWFTDTSKAKAWAPRTESAYRTSLKRISTFNGKKVADIRRLDVQEFSSTALKNYSAKTVNFDMSTLHAVLDFGVRQEYLSENVAHRAPRPRVKKKAWRILTPEEIQEVDRHFDDDKAQLIFRTLIRTGMRRGEIRHLKVQDIDFMRGALRVVESKTDEGERWMALPLSLVKQLQAWCEDLRPSEYVFQSSRHNPFNAEWYTNAFNRALAKAGITDYVRPFHDMRHTSLTNEAATGESNPLALMARAGHRSMETTRQYLKLAGVLFPLQAEALDKLLNGGS